NDREDLEQICFPRSRRPMARRRRIHAADDALRNKSLLLRLLVERLAAPVAPCVGDGSLPNRSAACLARAIAPSSGAHGSCREVTRIAANRKSPVSHAWPRNRPLATEYRDTQARCRFAQSPRDCGATSVSTQRASHKRNQDRSLQSRAEIPRASSP